MKHDDMGPDVQRDLYTNLNTKGCGNNLIFRLALSVLFRPCPTLSEILRFKYCRFKFILLKLFTLTAEKQ